MRELASASVETEDRWEPLIRKTVIFFKKYTQKIGVVSTKNKGEPPRFDIIIADSSVFGPKIDGNRMKKITLITSLYKGGKHIERFLDNITSQTAWEDCLLYILDANSPDEEYGVIHEYMAKHRNIYYERLDSDPGIYACWNHIVKKTESEFLTNANVDDMLFSKCIEKHLELLESDSSIDLAYCFNLEVHKPGVNEHTLTGEEPIYGTGPFSLYNLLLSNLPHNHPVWRRSLHDRFGYFDSSYHSAGDWDFWLRCASLGAKFELIPEKLGIYFRNPEGISSSQKDMDRNLKEVYGVRDKFVKMLSYLKQTSK